MSVKNLLLEKGLATITCNERPNYIPKIISGPIHNDNWIGASSGQYITINFTRLVYIEGISIWFYDKDGRFYTYSGEISKDGREYGRLTLQRNHIKSIDRIDVQKEAKSLRFSGGNDKNKSFHFIHLEIYGKFLEPVRTSKHGFEGEENLLSVPDLCNIQCNEASERIRRIVSGAINNNNWIGASKGTYITFLFSEDVYVDRIALWFYDADGRKYLFNAEYSPDGEKWGLLCTNKKVKSIDTLEVNKNVRGFRFSGENTTNKSFHFIHAEIFGFRMT